MLRVTMEHLVNEANGTKQVRHHHPFGRLMEAPRTCGWVGALATNYITQVTCTECREHYFTTDAPRREWT